MNFTKDWQPILVREEGEDLYFEGRGAPLVNSWINRHISSRYKISELIFWCVASFLTGFIIHAIWVS